MATWGCRLREGISAGLSALRSVNNLQPNRHECCLGGTPLNEGINLDAPLRDYASAEMRESCRDGPCEANLSSSVLLGGDFVGKSFSYG